MSMLKVLHIAYKLGEESAGTRIALSSTGSVNNIFLLGRKSPYKYVRDRQVSILLSSLLGIFFHITNILINKLLCVDKKEIFSTGLLWRIQSRFVSFIIRKHNVDVVHIHWGGYSYFPVKAYETIKIKIVLTVHDYNSFTGGCHLPMNCNQFDEGCNKCPLVKNRRMHPAISKIHKRNKSVLFEIKDRVVVVAPSHYALTKIKKKFPFLNFCIIHNPISDEYVRNDCNSLDRIYYEAIKERKGVLQILGVAIVESDRDNKGYLYLEEIIDRLNEKLCGFRVVLVGCSDINKTNVVNIERLDSMELQLVYNCSDITLVTSKYETFSQVTLESICSGTPVIAFDLSGPKDIIINGETGELIDSFDIVKYVDQMISCVNKKRDIGIKGVEAARDKFSKKTISKAYSQVYKSSFPANINELEMG